MTASIFVSHEDLGFRITIQEPWDGIIVWYRERFWGSIPHRGKNVFSLLAKESPLMEAWHGQTKPFLWS